ncbi:hypothetical protein [Desulfobulbus sp.]|uniref:hypothetical protein n=1 Tax=Desulfobulbus sp. TaxID=895 RepID=UPI00286F2102|nr:hypothetical protein [Desulfobulbus sp.]
MKLDFERLPPDTRLALPLAAECLQVDPRELLLALRSTGAEIHLTKDGVEDDGARLLACLISKSRYSSRRYGYKTVSNLKRHSWGIQIAPATRQVPIQTRVTITLNDVEVLAGDVIACRELFTMEAEQQQPAEGSADEGIPPGGYPLVGKKAAAKYLGVLSEDTITNYIKEGMPFDKVGGTYVFSHEIKSWFDERRAAINRKLRSNLRK